MHCLSNHFTHFPYVTGTLPAVALVVNPSVGRFAYVLWSPFKPSFLKIHHFLLTPQPPLVFIARSYGDLSSCLWKPGLCCLAWGWDYSLLRYPSWFLSTIHECEIVHSAADATDYSATPYLHLSAHLHVNCLSYLSGWMWLLSILGCWTFI